MHVDLPALLELMQFGHLIQLDVNRVLRSVNTKLMVVVTVAQRESDVLVDNLLEIVILIRIHSPSTLFVVQMHNLFCVLLHFVVGMLEYFLQNIMSCLDMLKLRFLGNDLIISTVVHIGFIIVLL
jgi:hypothetical protein